MGELGAGYQGIGTADAFRVFRGATIQTRMIDSAFRALHLAGVSTVVRDTMVLNRAGVAVPSACIHFFINRDSVDDFFRVGLHFLSTLHKLKLLKTPDSAHVAMFNKVCGGNVYARIAADEDVTHIVPPRSKSSPDFVTFMKMREKYLLYP